MPRLNIEPTRDDIEELIAAGQKSMDDIREETGVSVLAMKTPDANLAYHAGGVYYMNQLKKKLDLDQTSKPTRDDIDALIAEVQSIIDKSDDPIVQAENLAGRRYLERLKKWLALTKPTGKKMNRSSLEKDIVELLQANKERHGTEEPTNGVQMVYDVLFDLAKRNDIKIQDEEWA